MILVDLTSLYALRLDYLADDNIFSSHDIFFPILRDNVVKLYEI